MTRLWHGPIEAAVKRYERTQEPRTPFTESVEALRARVAEEARAARELFEQQKRGEACGQH